LEGKKLIFATNVMGLYFVEIQKGRRRDLFSTKSPNINTARDGHVINT
jgi:hypothetical protein